MVASQGIICFASALRLWQEIVEIAFNKEEKQLLCQGIIFCHEFGNSCACV